MQSTIVTPQRILDNIREQLKNKGTNTIRGLGRLFRQLDSFDGNKRVDKHEFEIGLREAGITNVTKQEIALVMQLLDLNQDGYVDFNEFLIAIRGSPNEARQALIDQSFSIFDKDSTGVITCLDLKGRYNTSIHPEVVDGKKVEDQVFMEFLQNFGDLDKNGKIAKQEWDQYYASVSASVDDDEHFIQLLKSAWKIQ